MKNKHEKKCRPIMITSLAYKTLKELIADTPKIDGSKMSLCEMASSLIMRAVEK